jgi:tetratricopeptide (TPR) repeat protein
VNPRQQRAALLMQQGRFADAERELRLFLAEEPESAAGHAALALVMAQTGRMDEAQRAAESAVHEDPQWPYTHYVRGVVMLRRGRTEAAREAAAAAIRLAPADADHHWLMSAAYLADKRWQAALEAAELGLTQDPNDVDCLNARAEALVGLGRKHDASAQLRGALARDPSDAGTHANLGWSLLHAGKPREALHAFREALRLRPGLEHARAGIVEALKAHNPLYRLILGWFLWMSRLPARTQFFIVFGMWVAMRVLRAVERSNPALGPYFFPIFIAYMAFAALTWIADPVFNLLLFLHPLGRHALDAGQKRHAVAVGLCLAGSVGCLAGGLALHDDALLLAALGWAFTCAPVTSAFAARHSRARLILFGCSALLVACGLVWLVARFAIGRDAAQQDAWLALPLAMILGGVAATWFGGLIAAIPRRQ